MIIHRAIGTTTKHGITLAIVSAVGLAFSGVYEPLLMPSLAGIFMGQSYALYGFYKRFCAAFHGKDSKTGQPDLNRSKIKPPRLTHPTGGFE
jgi:hypothetical protein